MTDLASQSLGYTPANKLSLSERRANYEEWKLAARRADRPMGVQTRTDEKPSPTELAAKRAQAHVEATSTLLNPLPPGAVCRTDEGDENAELSDDLRLKLAGALAKKIDGATPEQAATIAKAGNDLLAPMKARADNVKKDEDLKNTVINQGKVKKGSSPGAATAKADDEDEEKPRKVTEDDDDKGKGKHDEEEPPAWSKRACFNRRRLRSRVDSLN